MQLDTTVLKFCWCFWHVADSVYSKWWSCCRENMVSVCSWWLHCYWVYFHQYPAVSM